MSTWQTRLSERKGRFLLRASERLQNAAQAIEQLAENRADQQLLRSLYQDFHKLAGPAGIYEMPNVCQHSIAAEDLCQRLIDTAEAPSDDDLLQLRQFVKSLLEALGN